jgi:uncharacterized Zn finger protein (UPF0148 family)
MKTECPNCKHRFQTVDVDGVMSERKLMRECLEESREREEAIARLAQATQEREHNAYQALMWRGIAERLANLIKRMKFGDTFPAITDALAAFEEAQK